MLNGYQRRQRRITMNFNEKLIDLRKTSGFMEKGF